MNLKEYLKYLLKKTRYNLVKNYSVPPDLSEDLNFIEIYKQCQPHTMVSLEGCYSTYTAVDYIIKNNIPGDIVECGVWRGGVSMMIIMKLIQSNIFDRKVWLYDT